MKLADIISGLFPRLTLCQRLRSLGSTVVVSQCEVDIAVVPLEVVPHVATSSVCRLNEVHRVIKTVGVGGSFYELEPALSPSRGHHVFPMTGFDSRDFEECSLRQTVLLFCCPRNLLDFTQRVFLSHIASVKNYEMDCPLQTP